MENLPSLYARPAIIKKFDPVSQQITFVFTDQISGRAYQAPCPHPFASLGYGVFAAPKEGTRIMVIQTSQNRYYPISVVPLNAYSSLDFTTSDSNLTNISVSQVSYPKLKPGDVVLQSFAGAQLYLSNDGIKLKNKQSFLEMNSVHNSTIEYHANHYENTEAFRMISGLIKRDKRTRPKDIEKTADKLRTLSYDSELSSIGRNPTSRAEQITITLPPGTGITTSGSVTRNPSLTEHRTLFYEYSLSDMVEDYAKEKDRLDPEVSRSFLQQFDRRDMNRTDTLNLGMHLPNLLYESTVGTVVDIYGNILDINRNKIDFAVKGIENLDAASKQDPAIELQNTLSLLRRSIKYHFEINSRKQGLSEAPQVLDGIPVSNQVTGSAQIAPDQATATGYSHSRFSFDIDGEGFLKVNIPATSNTGNIPLLARYVNDFDNSSEDLRNSGSFRSEEKIDILHMAFGAGDGIAIDPSYAPNNVLEGLKFSYKTAYHDILSTASETGAANIINTNIRNNVTDPNPNAGGRSIHLNADGSAEVNIGRDIADKKSIILDTAGSIVSRIGKDINDFSVISQLDGNINIQVGGEDGSQTIGDSALPANSIKFYIKATDGFHTVIIDSTGIKINSALNTNIDVNSAGDLNLRAGNRMLLTAPTIVFYGPNGERLLLPTGFEIK